MFKILIIFLGISLAACRRPPFYRRDYTYIEEFDAFYKLHSDSNGVSWNTAFSACEIEGAQLFYPKAPEEWKIVNTLIESKGLAKENFTDIYVGIKNYEIDEFITIDGLTTPSPLNDDNNLLNGDLCTTMDVENGSLNIELCSDIAVFTPKPFVCKKVEDISCPTIDKGYKYVKETKKCYKVNKMAQTWHDALNTCVMEGGLLVNIESEMEAKILKDRLKDNTFYHAGFMKIAIGNDYFNLKGINIKDTYEKWYSNNDSNKKCGAIIDYSDTTYLEKVECGSMLPFLCEIEIKL